MIEKLTKEQEAGIKEWQEHCLKIGRDTSPVNKKIVEQSWLKFYKILGKEKPSFWYCQSPLQAQIIINIFPEIQKIFDIKKGANIWADIRANIGDNIGDNIKKLDFKYIDTYSWCQHDINWIGYYKYFEKYGLLPYDKNFEIFDIWYDLACSCGWCYTFENIVFVCEKPSKIYLNRNGQLHKDLDMALEYSDGYGLWMLNGIRVTKEIVMTPAEKLDPLLALKETNADVQREIIRKIGAERMLKASNAKLVDIWDETSIRKGDVKRGTIYKLYEMNIGERIRRKYLVYEHANLEGITYANAVPPETQKALHGRAFNIKLVNRDELKSITKVTEAEIIANLPQFVS